jgi:hypothetical protein
MIIKGLEMTDEERLSAVRGRYIDIVLDHLEKINPGTLKLFYFNADYEVELSKDEIKEIEERRGYLTEFLDFLWNN